MYTHPRYSVQISIHALREEGDGLHDVREDDTWYFYPRPPRGGRRHRQVSQGNCKNFYPRPPRGGRPFRRRFTCSGREISIHALREEGDRWPRLPTTASGYFYPRPPRGGRRIGDYFGLPTEVFLSTPSARRATVDACNAATEIIKFLSTPSARRATSVVKVRCWIWQYFYPRPPRGGRQQKQRQNLYFLINYTTFCTNLEEP